ncbi:MAG: heme utilization cystosolic carrier protein HutX [Afipia sp.]|nr:heme utilization cystosolic carrier protein HutX [Afipia sp.]OJW66267.1 MAG: coproporphyrinogen III oxidase [Afipia sp. 64-13]
MLSTDLAALKKHMAENPGGVIEDVARDKNATCRAVLEALPEEMRSFAPGSAFVEAMQDIATWGQVTLIIHTDDGIFEVTDPVSQGEIGRGYFNLSGPKGLHGHLRHERCGGLAFVERPFMGKSSAFVAFINVDGGVMFKVFVGRDEARQLKADQMERFHALATKLQASR